MSARYDTQPLAFRIESDVWAKLREIADEQGCTMSDLLRRGALMAIEEPSRMVITWTTPPHIVQTATDAATAPTAPGEGDGTGSGPQEAHRGAEGFRPFDPSVSAAGDQISVWGDDRELCVLDVSNAEVLRDMLDDMIGSLGGKSIRQAERARIVAFIRSTTPHYDGKIAALLNLIETDQMER